MNFGITNEFFEDLPPDHAKFELSYSLRLYNKIRYVYIASFNPLSCALNLFPRDKESRQSTKIGEIRREGENFSCLHVQMVSHFSSNSNQLVSACVCTAANKCD